MDNTIENVKISWSAKEHVHREKSIDFYWGFGLVGLVLVIVAFVLHNALLGIIILLGTGLFIYSSIKGPQEIYCAITDKAVIIGDDVYNFDKIIFFRVMDTLDSSELILNIRRNYSPFVSVHINKEDKQKIYNILIEIVEENDKILPSLGSSLISRLKL